MRVKLSKDEWERAGKKAGWIMAKRYNRICAWCGEFLGVMEDKTEPLNEQGEDTHGLCDKCYKKMKEEGELSPLSTK